MKPSKSNSSIFANEMSKHLGNLAAKDAAALMWSILASDYLGWFVLAAILTIILIILWVWLRVSCHGLNLCRVCPSCHCPRRRRAHPPRGRGAAEEGMVMQRVGDEDELERLGDEVSRLFSEVMKLKRSKQLVCEDLEAFKDLIITQTQKHAIVLSNLTERFPDLASRSPIPRRAIQHDRKDDTISISSKLDEHEQVLIEEFRRSNLTTAERTLLDEFRSCQISG